MDIVEDAVAYVDCADGLPLGRDDARFFGQFAGGDSLHIGFAGMRSAARDLPRIAVYGVAPLADENDFVALVQRDDAYRRADFDDAVNTGLSIGPEHLIFANANPGIFISDAAA